MWREFVEFEEMFGMLLSRREISEIAEMWGEECRNARVLEVWDRNPRRASSPIRARLIRWLDAHPENQGE